MQKQKLKRIWSHAFLLVSLIGLALFAPATAAGKTADTSTSKQKGDISQAVTQSYNADASVQQGMVVKLKDGDANTVEPLVEATSSKILGIVVAPNAATVTLTPSNIKAQQVFVATVGRYSVLVSTQNGSIKTGDFIAMSAVAGVGMKAGQDQSIVIGKAASGFGGTAGVVSSLKLTDSSGGTNTVAIGRINVDLAIAHNPLEQKNADYLPSFLAKAAQTVSGKPVSAARIYIGLAVLVVCAFVTGSIVYSGVRNGMQAIGRNPMARKSIIRSLIQTVIAGLIIFVAGIFAVYLLLKL